MKLKRWHNIVLASIAVVGMAYMLVRAFPSGDLNGWSVIAILAIAWNLNVIWASVFRKQRVTT